MISNIWTFLCMYSVLFFVFWWGWGYGWTGAIINVRTITMIETKKSLNKGFFPPNGPAILHTCMPTECEPLRPILFPPQTWWLLNLFLVSFDKLPCLHWDIPLTQPLVIVYTTSRQSRHALSDFDSNIHFASEVAYRKWLDRSSLFLQLPPPSSPTVFPLTLTSFAIVVVTAR